MMPFRSTVLLHRLHSDIEALPALPPGVWDLVTAGCTDTARAEDLVEFVVASPALSRVVLRSANALARSAADTTTLVPKAVSKLGVSRTVISALSLGLGAAMDQMLDGYGQARRQMWQHSIVAAHVAETVRELADTTLPAEIVPAALLHDVGVVMMHRHLGSRRRGAASAARSISSAVEANVFGIDHAELGAQVACHWGLSVDVQNAIRFHHDPEAADSLLAYGVSIASEIGDHVLSNDAQYPAHLVQTLDRLGLDLGRVEAGTRTHLAELGMLKR